MEVTLAVREFLAAKDGLSPFPPITKDMQDLMNSLPSVNVGMSELSTNAKNVGESVKTITGEGGGGGFGGGGFMNELFMGLGNAMMLMYLPQMITTTFGAIGTSMYNLAAIAEGPAAHGINTYTGQIDLLNTHVQTLGATFAEAYGQQVEPGIKSLNAQLSTPVAAAYAADFGAVIGSIVKGIAANPISLIDPVIMSSIINQSLKPEVFASAAGVTGGSGFQNLGTSADQLQVHFEMLNKSVGVTGESFSQVGSVMYQMIHEPLAQQLVDIQSGSYKAVMDASSMRINFSPPTPMGQFSSPYPFEPNPWTGAWSNYYTPPPPPPPAQQVQPYAGLSIAGIQLPDLSGIGSQIMSAFSDITMPALPDKGATIGGQLAGMFADITMPTIPGFGAMITALLAAAFSGITMPTVPHFATGVENFGGGLALVGEKGPELLQLPKGAGVYPMTGGASMAGGSGGGASSGQVIHNHIYIGGEEIARQVAPFLVSEIRQQAGIRR